MGYKIPPDDLLEEIILRIIKAEHVVESQAALTREVLKHLRRIDKDYRVSGKRIRRIAIKLDEVKVEIRCKITDREVEKMETCPVCGEKMERMENMTLEGKRVIMGFKCTFCPYWTGVKLRVPTRYIFKVR